MFKPANDIRYLAFLNKLHAKNLFEWYLEIGTRNGRSFAPARGNAIAVDPKFQISSNVLQMKRSSFFFQSTSDVFFCSNFLKINNIRLSFSFLDGMHLFEFLLRDFINIERNTKIGGAIALHDCCPPTFDMTVRSLRDRPKGGWTGDVWKMVPILQRYRPELKLEVIGCKPTGIVIVLNTCPTDTTLEDHYDEIVAQYTSRELTGVVLDEFYASFDYVNAADFLSRSEEIFKDVCINERE
ncbi:hypothetical protein [Tateyamaria sp. ANG-S1]|uniref:hypothetical protein n=1 Tax=Tateyamaria sp. ANG-S1 TaxID=1577905 RepID=UPI000A6E3552|nr:hypothetical protein [Tateyamaria sp. ANG-S1]